MNIEHNVILVLLTAEKRNKVADYYEKQERLLEGFVEMETVTETGRLPGSLTEVGCVHLDNLKWMFIILVLNVNSVQQNRKLISEFRCRNNNIE